MGPCTLGRARVKITVGGLGLTSLVQVFFDPSLSLTGKHRRKTAFLFTIQLGRRAAVGLTIRIGPKVIEIYSVTVYLMSPA